MNAVEQAEAIINALLPDPARPRCAGEWGMPGYTVRCIERAVTRCDACDRLFCLVCLLPEGLCLECSLDYGPMD